MLRDYDAKAIADIMGLAFVDTGKAGRPAGPPKHASGAGKYADDFVIRVNDSTIHVVEVKDGNSLATFSAMTDPLRAFASQDRKVPSQVFIEKIVEYGLPRKALRHVAENIAGGDKTKIVNLERGIVPKTTLDRRARLTTEESERTERAARLFVHARRALGTDEEAREFLAASHPELDGRSPIEAARTDLGTRRVESILNALEFGLAL